MANHLNQQHGKDDDVFPCDQHERELASIRGLIETATTDLAVMKKLVEMLQHSLFGNGQPGIIAGINKRLDGHDRFIWIALGIVTAMNFLSGSGIVSLKNLIGK